MIWNRKSGVGRTQDKSLHTWSSEVLLQEHSSAASSNRRRLVVVKQPQVV